MVGFVANAKDRGYLTPSVRTIHRKYSLSNTSAADRDSASLTTVLSSVDMGLIFERPTIAGGTDATDPRTQALLPEGPRRLQKICPVSIHR